MPPLRITLKSFLQLGIPPLMLNALYRFGLWSGHYSSTGGTGSQSGSLVPRFHPIFTLPHRAHLLHAMGTQGRAALLKEANEIVVGRARLFGGKPVPLELTPKKPLQHWTAYERDRSLLRSFTLPHGDVKYLWEPARFGWAFTLGRAYQVTGNEKFAVSFWSYFKQFQSGNPPYLGPNWMNGQEAAIRLLALVWSAQAFTSAAASTPQRMGKLAQAIARHAARIPPTLIYARAQNNNHLLTEAAALFTAGCTLDHGPWRDLGWRWLNRALQNQIGSDGEYIQFSTNYHRLMLQSALWVDAILRGRGEEWPAATLDALERASHWLLSIVDTATGFAPNLGANDGSLILPLSSSSFSDYRPTAQAAARAFLRTDLPAGPWDELSLWFALPANQGVIHPETLSSALRRSAGSWSYLRASSFRSRLGHMDQLHLDLWWRGLNIAQDAGTYLYNASPPWDNPLVSARVHNTITVDGRDQMTRGGRFLTLDWFPAYSREIAEDDPQVLDRRLAHHNGYRDRGLRHERLATLYVNGHWEIKDHLIFANPTEHVLRLHWLLPDWKYEIVESQFKVRLKSPHGWIILRITSDARLDNGELHAVVIRAGKLVYGKGQARPFEGWVSPTYGTKIPALSLAVEVRSSSSTSFTSDFFFPD